MNSELDVLKVEFPTKSTEYMMLKLLRACVLSYCNCISLFTWFLVETACK